MIPSLDHPSPPGARILIVDDEPDNRELLQIVLNWEGFVTETAASGVEALVSATKHPPDLMLLDLMMPGLDGCQVIAELRRNPRTQGIPVMIISATSDGVARTRTLAAGAEAFVTKPIDRADLCRQVRSLLLPKEDLRLGRAGSG